VKIRCISLWQPWGTAIFLNLKRNETRGKLTHVRGRIGIHAAGLKSKELREFYADMILDNGIKETFGRHGFGDFDDLPFGAILGTVTLHDCQPTTKLRGLDPVETQFGNYSPGRFAWMLTDVNSFTKPFPFSGKQGFFFADIPDSIVKPHTV